MRALLLYDIPHSQTWHDYEQKMKINLKAWVISTLPYLAAFFRCIELITPTQCPLYWFSLHCWLPLAHTTLALFVWLMFYFVQCLTRLPSIQLTVCRWLWTRKTWSRCKGRKRRWWRSHTQAHHKHFPEIKTISQPHLTKMLQPDLKKCICAMREQYNLHKHWIRKFWFWFRISKPHFFS